METAATRPWAATDARDRDRGGTARRGHLHGRTPSHQGALPLGPRGSRCRHIVLDARGPGVVRALDGHAVGSARRPRGSGRVSRRRRRPTDRDRVRLQRRARHAHQPAGRPRRWIGAERNGRRLPVGRSGSAHRRLLGQWSAEVARRSPIQDRRVRPLRPRSPPPRRTPPHRTRLPRSPPTPRTRPWRSGAVVTMPNNTPSVAVQPPQPQPTPPPPDRGCR